MRDCDNQCTVVAGHGGQTSGARAVSEREGGAGQPIEQ